MNQAATPCRVINGLQSSAEVYPAFYSGAVPLNALLERIGNPAIGANEHLKLVQYPDYTLKRIFKISPSFTL